MTLLEAIGVRYPRLSKRRVRLGETEELWIRAIYDCNLPIERIAYRNVAVRSRYTSYFAWPRAK